MRIIVVYRERSDYARTVEEFLHDFKYQTGGEIETLDPDTREGIGFCQAYGIVEYPTLIAIDYSGVMQQMWRGLPLPRISELSYYNQP
ncbi:MAG: hypothetical protein ACOX0Z_02055 [Candidatus Nanosyncoccaceae bacterium]|jgi:hypothetical protein